MVSTMITSKIIILPILAALITCIFMPMARRFSIKIGAVDKPNNSRKIHSSAVPYGGIAIFAGFLAAVLFFNNTSPEILGFLIGCMVLIGVGFLDDVFDLSPFARIFGQVLAALIVIAAGIRVDVIGNFGNGNDGLFSLGVFSLPFTLLWIVGITNAIRILDGLDGLASGVTGIAAWTLGIVALLTGRYDTAVLSFILGAVAFAFLPYNFSDNPDRKVFMGDVGSNFFGFAIAVVSIMGTVKTAAAFSMLIPILVLAVPIFDTVFAIIRRIISGKSPFQADRMHLHHRIMDSGLGHKKTTFVIYGISLVLGAISIISVSVNPGIIPIMFAVTAISFVLFLWKLGLIKLKLK